MDESVKRGCVEVFDDAVCVRKKCTAGNGGPCVLNGGRMICLYCRIKLNMRKSAAQEGKYVPTEQWVDYWVDRTKRCPACGIDMTIDPRLPLSTRVTLQHCDNGLFTLLCQGCNVAHGSTTHPDRDWYIANRVKLFKNGKHWCSSCKEFLNVNEFSKSVKTTFGLNNQCGGCFRRKSSEWLRKRFPRSLRPNSANP